MSVLLIAQNKDLKPLKEALEEFDSNLDVEVWPKVEKKDRVNFVVSWNHPKEVLQNYPNLKVVQSYGAGVNHILGDKNIPKSVKISRTITPSLKIDMAEYVLNAVQNYRNHIYTYVDKKKEGFWSPSYPISKEDCTVGIMGLGMMGESAAKVLAFHGFKVNGWSNSRKNIEGVQSFAGKKELNSFLESTNILVCLLPLTEETRGILDLDVFKKLKKPAYLIQAGRGQHLVEEDLIYALDMRFLEGACLDVFEVEPLPSNHVFWSRSNIMITPHVASITNPKEAAAIILENYKRMLSGMDLINEVNREEGY